jgi:cytochrome P450
MSVRSAVDAPALDVDLYEPAALRDSRRLFAEIRAAGPVVRLPRHRMYAIGRFEDVRAALRDDEVFRSGKGVAANPMTNVFGRGTTLFSDDEAHRRRRRVLMRSLGAKALKEVGPVLDEHAERLVERLLERGRFEAVRDFSSYLPLAVVADLVGLRADGQRLLRWAAAAFDTLGPLNRRGLRAAGVGMSLLLYSLRIRPDRVAPGSWAASVLSSDEAGELSPRESRALVIDLVAPALDTTILASTHLLWTLARNPESWSRIAADPELVATAVVEDVRISSPIRGFTRYVAREHEVGGIRLPAGARVALLFGAANLDETRFPDPERFDLDRADPNTSAGGTGPMPASACTWQSWRCRRCCERWRHGWSGSRWAPPSACRTTPCRASPRCPRASTPAELAPRLDPDEQRHLQPLPIAVGVLETQLAQPLDLPPRVEQAVGGIGVLERLADRGEERRVQARSRRRHVLEVGEDPAGVEQIERLLVERALALMLEMVDREGRDHGVETADVWQRQAEVVAHQLDAPVAGETLAGRAEHQLGEVHAHRVHPRALALKQCEQSPVAGAEVEDAADVERHLFEQDRLPFGPMRKLIGPIEIAAYFALVERPLLAGHRRIIGLQLKKAPRALRPRGLRLTELTANRLG